MTVELELSVDSQSIGSFSHLRAKELHDVRHLVLVHLFLYQSGIRSWRVSPRFIEFTVLEEIFSNRTPCSLLFPLANQLYFGLK